MAFIGQSGALITAILDWSLRERVGFSSIVSLGSMADVGWGDLIDHLGDDPETDAIVLYMETVGDARASSPATREVARTKPVIVMKLGGPPRRRVRRRPIPVADGERRGPRRGVWARRGPRRRAHLDLFYFAEVLGKQPCPAAPPDRPEQRRGPSSRPTRSSAGGKLAELAPDTMAALDAVLPPTWSHGNPVDIIGDAPPERYAAALEVDPRPRQRRVAGHPHPPGDDRPHAHRPAAGPIRVRDRQADPRELMGGLEVEAGDRILREAGSRPSRTPTARPTCSRGSSATART